MHVSLLEWIYNKVRMRKSVPADEEAAEGEDDDENEGGDEDGGGNEEDQPLVLLTDHRAALAHV